MVGAAFRQRRASDGEAELCEHLGDLRKQARVAALHHHLQAHAVARRNPSLSLRAFDPFKQIHKPQADFARQMQATHVYKHA